MTEIATIEDFYSRAMELYEHDPIKTRFTYKYRNVDGKLELKITSDRLCFKFLTDQMQDVKRMEKLNRTLMFTMLNVPVPDLPEPAAEPAQVTPTQNTESNSNQQPPTVSQSANKKKKKKGKK